jgi:hypothetical protein
MLLRIQTVFLSLATILTVLFIKLPYSGMSLNDDSLIMLTFSGLKDANDPDLLYNRTIALTILVILTGLLSLVTIFLYNNRKLQLRLCVLNILLTIGFILALPVYYIAFKNGVGLAPDVVVIHPQLRWPLIIPFINIVLIFQAFRAIRRDDLLIKSLDRLR